MPRLLIDEGGFRVVHDVVSGDDVFTLERREGENAMGEPHWVRVESKSTKLVSMLYQCIIKLALEREATNAADE